MLHVADRYGLQFDNLPGEDLVRYLEHLNESRTTATVRRRLMSISSVISLAQQTDNTRHPDVKLTMKRIYRQKVRAQLQVSPYTRDVNAKLLKVCSNDTRGLRDRILLELGYV